MGIAWKGISIPCHKRLGYPLHEMSMIDLEDTVSLALMSISVSEANLFLRMKGDSGDKYWQKGKKRR